MKKIKDLRDLLLEQGREIYEAIVQEESALPRTERQASNPNLKRIINRQWETARNQQNRLERAFNKLESDLKGEKNPCSEAIIDQTDNLIGRSSDPKVTDAIIVSSLQRLNHLKITGFGSLAAYAHQMGDHELAELLHEGVEEERRIDKDLSKLAESKINAEAMQYA